MQFITKVEEGLKLSSFNKAKPVDLVAAKLKVAPEHVSLGYLGILSAFLLLTCTGHCLLQIVFTLLLPAWFSIKLLKENFDGVEVKKWVTYWICFAVCFSFKNLIERILFFFPFKTLVLTGLLVSLYTPWTNGHELVYAKVFTPLYTLYTTHIQQLLDLAKDDVDSRSNKKKRN